MGDKYIHALSYKTLDLIPCKMVNIVQVTAVLLALRQVYYYCSINFGIIFKMQTLAPFDIGFFSTLRDYYFLFCFSFFFSLFNSLKKKNGPVVWKLVEKFQDN